MIHYLALLPLLSATLGLMAPMRTWGHLDRVPARLALLMLRASLPEEMAVDDLTYLIGDQRVPMDPDSAAGFLAGRPKPLRCEAITEGRHMVVLCDSITAPDEASLHAHQVEVLEGHTGFWGGLLQNELGGRRDAQILIVGRGEFLVVSFDVAERLERDYLITMPMLTLSGGPPDPDDVLSNVPGVSDEILGGVSCVVIANRSGEVRPFHETR